MLTQNPCGIILKFIRIMGKDGKEPINGYDILDIINKIQDSDKSILIYNTYKNGDSEEIYSSDYWNDINVLEESGIINVRHSIPKISITLTGCLSADSIEIPKKIEEKFINIINK